MRPLNSAPIHALVVVLGVLTSLGVVAPSPASGQETRPADFKTEFLKLCDVAAEELNSDSRHALKPVPFYQDSYAVRALAVAYDMTGRKQYLDACRRWSDRMVFYQSQMVPQGAYYMNYNRKPGEKGGPWYVADSSSIAMGALATAVRCADPADKDLYLDSVKAFAKLVIDNYIGEAGGIMNGLWPKYGGEWWCSTGLFGSLAFLLYEETGEEKYRTVGLDAIDWLNRLEFRRIKFQFWTTASPSVVMYVLEAYSAGLPHLKVGTELHAGAMAQLSRMLDWMAKNQRGRGAKSPWDYDSQWGSKLGGLPFHMYVYAQHAPAGQPIREAADQELRFVSSLLSKDDQPRLSQLAAFSMMSYAERVSPGAIYRTSRKSRINAAP